MMLLAPAGMSAHKTMREAWVIMPDSMIPYLSQKLRVELVDYWDMKAEAKVKNMLEGETRLLKMTDRYMKLRLNEKTEASFRLLETGDSTYIICMVKTFCAPEKESTVSFYSPEWLLLEGQYGVPAGGNPDSIKASFIAPRDTMPAEKYNKLCAMIEPLMVAAELDETEETVTLSLSLPFLTKEEKKDVYAILRQRKFKWSGRTFKEC